jgi:hypothetical protein
MVHVKPGGTAGFPILSQQFFVGQGLFVFIQHLCIRVNAFLNIGSE